jgi:hypothetical protein
MSKTLFLNILAGIVFFTLSCSQDKGVLITRTWQLDRVRGKIDTLKAAIPQDEYHTVLTQVINEHRKHCLRYGAITWIFNADSTFKIIFRDNSNETDDNKWRIKGDTLYLAVWHNDFFFKFLIKTISKKELILENDELGKRPIILMFSAKKEN